MPVTPSQNHAGRTVTAWGSQSLDTVRYIPNPLPPTILNAIPQDLVAQQPAVRQRRLVQDWLAWLSTQVAVGQYAADTVETYDRNLRLWIRFLEEVARTDAPTPGTVADFVAAILPRRKPAAVNVVLHSLRSLYRWAEAHDRSADIARAVRAVRQHGDDPLPALTHDEILALLAQLPEDGTLARLRDRALIATLYGTACRCISLQRADVRHYESAGPTLRHSPKGHRGVDAAAQVPPSVARMIDGYLAARRAAIPTAPEDPLFIALDRGSKGRRLTTRSMRRIILAAMECAGHARRDAEGELVNPGVFSAHSLRRSALTTAADAEGLEAAQALAGHARIETTRRAYVRVKMHERLRRVAGALDIFKRPDPGGTTTPTG
jgi:site-specific recombinase XerD